MKTPPLVAKCGVVQPCLNNIHQTVAAVASVTTDIERSMFNIRETSSNAETGEINYIFPDEKESVAPTPPPRHHRKSRQKTEGCESPYSYDNCTYTPSPEEDDFEEVFLPSRPQDGGCAGGGGGGGGVDHKVLNQSLIACAMRDKLRSDLDDRPPSTPHSQSDYEIPKNDGDSSSNTTNTPNHLPHIYKSLSHTPPLTPKQIQQLKLKDSLRASSSPLSSSNGCLSGTSIFIIDTDSNPVSPGHKPKFRKSAQVMKALHLHNTSLTRSCSCTSDTSASGSPQRDLEPCKHSESSHSLANQHLTSSQNLPVTSAEQPDNSHNNNNLNYYTFHHPSAADYNQQVQPQHHSHPHRIHSPPSRRPPYHQEKFSPFRAVSNLIFPPIVKHSSLFQLFHPSSNSETTTPLPSPTVRSVTPQSKSSNPSSQMTDSVNYHRNSCEPSNQDVNDSIASVSTEVVDVSSLEVTTLTEIKADS